jgi:hypothetical protein
LFETLIVTLWFDDTFRAVALKLMLEVPADIVTDEGTGSTVELLLRIENESPPDGATAPVVSVIRISVEVPEGIVEGVAVTLP